MFDFEAALHPVKRDLPVSGAMGDIVLELAPFDSRMAFDCLRWQSLALSNRVVDADEFQARLGTDRVIGWKNVRNAKGDEVPFTLDNLNAFARMTSAIPYLQEAGRVTLEEGKVIEAREKKEAAEPAAEASPPPGE